MSLTIGVFRAPSAVILAVVCFRAPAAPVMYCLTGRTGYTNTGFSRSSIAFDSTVDIFQFCIPTQSDSLINFLPSD